MRWSGWRVGGETENRRRGVQKCSRNNFLSSSTSGLGSPKLHTNSTFLLLLLSTPPPPPSSCRACVPLRQTAEAKERVFKGSVERVKSRLCKLFTHVHVQETLYMAGAPFVPGKRNFKPLAATAVPCCCCRHPFHPYSPLLHTVTAPPGTHLCLRVRRMDSASLSLVSSSLLCLSSLPFCDERDGVKRTGK